MLFTDTDSLALFDAELLFTDTDSLTLDFSNYPKDSKFFDETNKKVIGKMKDEFGGVIVEEFVQLKLFYKKLMVKNVIQQKE